MIAFACAHCGMKFQVKPEFAGRSTLCPTCKQPLTVPTDTVGARPLPESCLEGPPTSLSQAGIAGEVTLAANVPAADDETRVRPGAEPPRSVAEVLQTDQSGGQRYLLEGEVARGGMGAVLRAVDRDIRREVAIKYLLDQSDPRKKARFVEEAQVTGQLEHPNIVPVHELGIDARGHLFFSMKMVKGRSLQQVLQELREEPRSAGKEWPLSRLLNIFVGVCHALAYAHSRGVVHRDLKPANIMVGDFGEVYVMDWGLAKVMTRMDPAARPGTVIQSAPSFAWTETEASSGPVQTSRSADEDKTLDGQVMGTALYMPPEQALGRISDIDPRSDIYALGAVLYVMLTLEPPVDRTGGFQTILQRVTAGEILPPEMRAPARHVPPELSAVAMKALAKDRQDRYASVEGLRRDIERYLEGRSVSAKQDTLRELFWKLVKRNRGVSAALAVALVVITVIVSVGYRYNYQARRKAETAYAQYLQEQSEKETRTQLAVPALVHSALLLANQGQHDEAWTQVELALNYEPGHAAALLRKAQLQMARKNWPAAEPLLAEYLRQHPRDADARKLAELCAARDPNDPTALLAAAAVLQRQKVYGLANLLLQELERKRELLKPLLATYQKQIDAEWRGMGKELRLDESGRFVFALHYGVKGVRNLDPLKGIPLSRLVIKQAEEIKDLAPLKGMPLDSLEMRNCRQITDLAPLEGMPLRRLMLADCRVLIDLGPLRGMPLRELELHECDKIQDLTPLQGMPLTRLSLRGCGLVGDLKPLRGTRLTRLNLDGCRLIRNLDPLEDMPLEWLRLNHCPVENLLPLNGMPLRTVILQRTKVRSLEPLADSPLTTLNISHTPIESLAPLAHTPLQRLFMHHTPRLHDVTPLKEVTSLEAISFTPANIKTGMDILRGMKGLQVIGWSEFQQATAEEFWKKYDAGNFKKARP
jgi:serine/threonine protein kinase